MTSLPDWLVERAALHEVPPASRDRIERADPSELAGRVAALGDASADELARHPAGPAVAQIEAQIEARAAAGRRQRAERRRRRMRLFGLATSAAAVLIIARVVVDRPAIERGARPATAQGDTADGVRVKGLPWLAAFRQAGAQAERLEQDAVVRAGDVIQLRYNAGGHRYGVIASLDGAGVVTLHYPLREDAPPQATAVAPQPTALPHAYALDDAPRFERFFFITADGPVDVQQILAVLRTLARRGNSATAVLELPPDLEQYSLRLRKADRNSPNHESP